MKKTLIIDLNNYDQFKKFIITADFNDSVDGKDYYILDSNNELKTCLNPESSFANDLWTILRASQIIECIDISEIWEWFLKQFENRIEFDDLKYVFDHFKVKYTLNSNKNQYMIDDNNIFKAFDLYQNKR